MDRFEGQGLVCWRGERVVFGGLGFAVAGGHTLLLRGPNGSGKSSLLRCMAGLLAPMAGRMAWNGAVIAGDTDGHRHRVRYIGHLEAIKPLLTVAENLALWSRLQGGSDDAIAAGLAALGIAHLAELPARLLSAGQRRRTALARLTLAPAPLWLLDEPTTGLDDEGVERFQRLIAAHCDSGGMAVLSTHIDTGVRGSELSLADFAVPPVAA